MRFISLLVLALILATQTTAETTRDRDSSSTATTPSQPSFLVAFQTKNVAEEAETATISAETAVKLALKQYHLLFSDKYYFNPVDSKYHRFPRLEPSQFHRVEKDPVAWILHGEPPAGVYVNARVDLAGRWVQLTGVGFNSQ